MSELTALRQLWKNVHRFKYTPFTADEWMLVAQRMYLSSIEAEGLLGTQFDLESFIKEQIEFSNKTFGPGTRLEGVLKHIDKEAVEVWESKGALDEWVDIIILAIDGAWRSGATPPEIVKALQAKLERNKSRNWPDWRSQPINSPIEHIRD